MKCATTRSPRNDLKLDDLEYQAGGLDRSTFCPLSLPKIVWPVFCVYRCPVPKAPPLVCLTWTRQRIIREVHVYGQSLAVGAEEHGAAQHIGLGSRLIQYAQDLARTQGYPRLAVISAIGTRRYYQRLGFQAR